LTEVASVLTDIAMVEDRQAARTKAAPEMAASPVWGDVVA
jgi:hypothetical protein